MRLKKDYMGNDQLLPAYNMQIMVCDEYIAAVDAKQHASDMDCFVPLEDCTGCPYHSQCYKGKKDRRVIRLNRELTQNHQRSSR